MFTDQTSVVMNYFVLDLHFLQWTALIILNSSLLNKMSGYTILYIQCKRPIIFVKRTCPWITALLTENLGFGFGFQVAIQSIMMSGDVRGILLEEIYKHLLVSSFLLYPSFFILIVLAHPLAIGLAAACRSAALGLDHIWRFAMPCRGPCNFAASWAPTFPIACPVPCLVLKVWKFLAGHICWNFVNFWWMAAFRIVTLLANPSSCYVRSCFWRRLWNLPSIPWRRWPRCSSCCWLRL